MDIKVDQINVFTDGSYTSSQPNVCGIGIHFPDHEHKDISQPFYVMPTNQRAELMAILVAIQTIRQFDAWKPSVIHVYTDSRYAIGCCTQWLRQWKKNGWKTTNDKDVANQDIVRPLSLVLDNVTFHHVRAHTNQTDWESKANAVADRLAKQAIKQSNMKKP